MQINRLFEIIYILLDKKRVTARELADRFCVSTRTIYRDIDTLSLAGIPIYTEKGKGGGISLLPDFVLNKSILSEQEQNEILAALYGLSNINPAETSDVLQKLSTIFNKPATNWLEVDFSDWYWANTTFEDFKTAVLQKRVAEFYYFNRHGQKSFRRIEPVLLWFKSRAWYVKGYCLTKNAPRLYRLSRVKNLIVTDEYFEQRDLHDSPDIPINMPIRHPKIKIKIAPEMIFRAYDEFEEEMLEKQPDGSVVATTVWDEDNWLYGFILSLGEHAQVLEPTHLRDIIKDKAKKIYEQYL